MKKRKIYIGSFTGNSINVHNPQQEYNEKIEQIKRIRTAINGVQPQCIEAASSFVSTMLDFSKEIVRWADRKVTEQPGLFYGCQPIVRPKEDLLVLCTTSRGQSRGSGLVGDLYHYVERTLNHTINIATDTLTLHPYDAICEVSDIVMDTTATGVELALTPIEGVAGIGGLAYATYQKVDAALTPYSECPCKLSLLNFFHQVISPLSDSLKAANSTLVTLVKSFADEMAYQFDPLKVGSITATMTGSVLFGVEKGLVNSIVNTVETGTQGYSILSNLCQRDDCCNHISPETLEIFSKIEQCADAIYDMDDMVKQVGQVMGQCVSAAIATKLRQEIKDRIDATSSKWEALGLYTASSLLPAGIDQDVADDLLGSLKSCLTAAAAASDGLNAYLKEQTKGFLKQMKNWVCKNSENQS